ncbi:MAG: signal peptidase I [Planctomycetaceae bacterium]|nr:signal peptidase I [Planctomycetaceae bacterium]
MQYTAIFLLSLLGVQVFTFVVWGLFLRLGLNWAKVPEITARKVVAATIVVVLLNNIVAAFALLTSWGSPALQIAAILGAFVITIIVPTVVVATTFKVSGWRAVQAWLPTLLSAVSGGLLVIFAYRPFIFETFVIPTNAMAPTIVGFHWQGTCPDCGAPTYCSPLEEGRFVHGPVNMICDNFHVTLSNSPEESVYGGDRIAVAKFLTPQRWDLAVFKFPQDPSVNYVKRVIGLPGEEVIIQDGGIWINGVRQQLPASLEGLEYVSEAEGRFAPDLWGTSEKPAMLGDDEYFVLGDFSAQSYDSRFWERGVDGHNPYAVPKSHMLGVVTTTYWPKDRWRAHK